MGGPAHGASPDLLTGTFGGTIAAAGGGGTCQSCVEPDRMEVQGKSLPRGQALQPQGCFCAYSRTDGSTSPAPSITAFVLNSLVTKFSHTLLPSRKLKRKLSCVRPPGLRARRWNTASKDHHRPPFWAPASCPRLPPSSHAAPRKHLCFKGLPAGCTPCPMVCRPFCPNSLTNQGCARQRTLRSPAHCHS